MNQKLLNLAGKTISEFEFIELIGHGGQAQVWKCKNINDKTTVAVKLFLVPRDGHHTSDELIRSFENEQKIISNLPNHKSLIRYLQSKGVLVSVAENGDVFEHSVDTDYPETNPYVLYYIAMELVQPGYSLGQYFESVVIGSRARAFKHVLEVCEALNELHKKGHVHCDFKPSNLLYSEADDTLKISDYGLTKYSSHETSTINGTPLYLAPECWRRGSETTKRDIYALGITIFELLTGQHPFRDQLEKTPHDLPHIHMSAMRPKLLKFCQGIIHPRLAIVIEDMMAPDPEDRPPLDTIMNALKVQLRTMRADSKSNLDSPPQYFTSNGARVTTRDTSPFFIHPTVRQKYLEEFCCWFSIRLSENSQRKQAAENIHLLLQNRLGKTYSLAEVLGTRTFLIQTWLKTELEVSLIARELAMLGNDVRVARCRNEECFAIDGPPDRISNQGYLLLEQLERLQGEEHESARAYTWLKRNRIIKDYPKWKDGIFTWCGAKFPAAADSSNVKQDTRSHYWTLKGLAENKLAKIHDISAIEVYFVDRESFLHLDEHAKPSEYDVIISFIAKNYDSVAKVSDCLRSETNFIPESIPETRQHTVFYQAKRDMILSNEFIDDDDLILTEFHQLSTRNIPRD